MAYLYSLAVECGFDQNAAAACCRYFREGAEAHKGMQVEATPHRSSVDGSWWAVVIPTEESRSGIVSTEVARSLTQAANALLSLLRGAPQFRFALVGVEVYEAISMSEFDEDLGADPTFPQRFAGLVINDEILVRLGSTTAFQPFAPGYSWIPYQGEHYPSRG